jgi:hypothetical protein
MPIAAMLAFLLSAVPSRAAVADAVAARSEASFPADYLHSIELSLNAQPFYASHLLNSFQTQVQVVAAFAPAPAAVYLEKMATGDRQSLADLRGSVGGGPLAPEVASALLLANSLVRPEQFREVMDGLETLKPGLGRHAGAALRAASGRGDQRVIAALRAAGERRPQPTGLTYGPDGRWATMFDGSAASRIDDSGAVKASPPDEAARARLPALTKTRPRSDGPYLLNDARPIIDR